MKTVLVSSALLALFLNAGTMSYESYKMCINEGNDLQKRVDVIKNSDSTLNKLKISSKFTLPNNCNIKVENVK